MSKYGISDDMMVGMMAGDSFVRSSGSLISVSVDSATQHQDSQSIVFISNEISNSDRESKEVDVGRRSTIHTARKP